jgi:hypothetical protein
MGTWNLNDLAPVQGNIHVAAPNAGGTGQNLAGFVWESQNTQHVFFIGDDGHIHELYYDTAWHHNDLTVSSGGPAQPVGHLAAYVWEKQSTEHIFYVGPGSDTFISHVRELYYDGKWHDHDLNQALPDAPPPDPYNASLVGYVFKQQNTAHVFYIGVDHHVHEFYYDNSWHHNDLTPGGVETAIFGGMTAFTCEYENTQHVFFINNAAGVGEAAGISELWWNGKWNLSQQIAQNKQGGYPLPAYQPPKLAGYSWESKKGEHVLFINSHDRHIHDVNRDNASSGPSWIETDLSSMVGNKAFLPLNPTPGLTGYVSESDGTEHIIYTGPSPGGASDIWELYYDGSTMQVGGSSQYGIPLPLIAQLKVPIFVDSSRSLLGYAWDSKKTEHIFFVTDKGTICELYHTP